MRLVLLSGLSGAGKTTARFALEDAGFFTVDNLPPPIWKLLLEHLQGQAVERAAVVFDVRGAGWISELPVQLAALRQAGHRVEVVFLEARPEVLLRRYNLTRRLHPLGTGSLMSELARERRVLAPIRELSDFIIDTSETSPRALKSRLLDLLGEARGFLLRLVSFGFKWGPPQDADLVLDARGFPNPYYDPELREKPGTLPEVQAYVFAPGTEDRYQAMLRLVGLSAEAAQREGRGGYTVAVGCTGGYHRSAALVLRLAEDLSSRYEVEVMHRDLGKD